MTDREKAIVMAYTGVCMLKGDKLSVFYDYVEEIMGSRLDAIQIAMLENNIKYRSKHHFLKLCAENEPQNAELLEKIKQLELERDAMKKTIKEYFGCEQCKHFVDEAEYVSNDCMDCVRRSNWEWRGAPEKEEEHEVDSD